jgi:hypothetical protein
LRLSGEVGFRGSLFGESAFCRARSTDRNSRRAGDVDSGVSMTCRSTNLLCRATASGII